MKRADLDLTDLTRIPEVLDSYKPEMVVNCAAYTAVDQAEDDEELAALVNGEAVGVMARWCAVNDVPLLTFSTDYVFDGLATSPYLESSSTSPVNAYGRSKLIGERYALEQGALVIRTSWVISGSHPNFVATMIRLARERTLKVVDDQIGCPTVAADLASASLKASTAGVTGLLHITNQGATTWFELAKAALEQAGIDTTALIPCSTDEYPTKAPRPAYSVLGSERSAGLSKPPHWRVSLPDVVAEITASRSGEIS